MSRRVQFSDLMLAEAGDFNDIGIYAQADDDAIVKDGLTPARKYAGFSVSILAGNTSVEVAPGRYYNGGIYREDSVTTLNFSLNLPLVQKRVGAIVVWGQEVDAGGEQRSVAVNVDDEIGEPQLLQMLKLRKANIELILGAESADPQVPAIPSNAIAVATVVIGTAGAESVAMNADNSLRSAQRNAEDIGDLNAFKSRIEPTVSGLISDLAALSARNQDRASREDLARGLADIARLKDLASLPDDYSQYGADFFDGDDETDTVYSTSVSKIDNGLLFPDAAASKWPLQLFNANDPGAKKAASGQVLPTYTDVVAIAGPNTNGDVSLSQYEVKTHTVKTHTVYRTYNYFGWGWNWSRRWYNYRLKGSAYWKYYGKYYAPYYWGYWGYAPYYYYYPHTVVIPETVTSVVTTTTSYNGILSAETFRAPRAAWFTGVNLKLTSLDATGDIHAFLTETSLGQPVLEKTLASVTIPVASLKKSPTKTPVMFNPTLLESGKLYAIVLITQGNHRIATVNANDWRDGTYFAGSDGEYFLGDLTKDIYMEVLVAEFAKPRNEIVLQTVDLVGGINDIKIETEEIIPSGTEISYEINISGTWTPLQSVESLPPGTNTAPLRAVLVGSKDLMPAFYTGTDRVTASRPALAMSHQSSTITLAAPASSIRLEYVVNKWDGAHHTLVPTIREGANVYTPSVTVPAVDNDPDGEAKKIAYVFNLGSPISSFKVRTDATREASVAPPAILERTHIAFA